ncbi:LacI family DNA-binding transcriptional regulator [bacterium]|nr:LacI family DNA-binding transcriptional regulator [bacterium]
MSRKPTLKDVAAAAGVSYQTVSKVLNGQGNVGQETHERILKAVDELSYRPNITARGLRNQATRLIGYSWKPMPPDQANPILDRFLSSLVKAAENAGYHVLLFPSQENDDDIAANYRELVRTNRVDGFILSSTNYDDERIRFLLDAEFPFVAFGRSNPDWAFDYIDVDGRAGIRAATRHLSEQGHSRIALLTWPGATKAKSRAGTSRTNGYYDAMNEAQLPIDPAWTREALGIFKHGFEQTQLLLMLPEDRRPTAVVAVDDQLAIGAMHAALESGLRIGAQFGVTGFDDTPGVQLLRPALTSVRQPIWDVGQRIVEVLVGLIQGAPTEQTQILLEPELIVRESSVRVGDL